jgi:hypothetical protein
VTLPDDDAPPFPEGLRRMYPSPTRLDALAILDVIEPKGVPGDQLDRLAWRALGYENPGDQFTLSAKLLRKPYPAPSQFYASLSRWADGKRVALSGQPDIELQRGEAGAVRQSAHYWFDRLNLARQEGNEDYPSGVEPLPPEPSSPKLPNPVKPDEPLPIPELPRPVLPPTSSGLGDLILLAIAAYAFMKS